MKFRYLGPIFALLLVTAAYGLWHRWVQAPPVSSPPEAPTKVPIPPGAAEVVQLAKEHFSKDKELDLVKIRVVRVESVEWGDTSLGCPQPGMMYAQVITPGYRIFLSDGSKEYEYHTDFGNQVVPCISTSTPSP